MENKLNFYDSFMIHYAESSDETKKMSKDHWLKCHMENVKSGRKDMIIFSNQILARIAIVDNGKYVEYFRNII